MTLAQFPEVRAKAFDRVRETEWLEHGNQMLVGPVVSDRRQFVDFFALSEEAQLVPLALFVFIGWRDVADQRLYGLVYPSRCGPAGRWNESFRKALDH